MKHLYPLLFFIGVSPLFIFSQSGPAGICSIDDEELILWLKPSEGLEDSSGYIRSWRSMATYYNDSSDALPGLLLEQGNLASRPKYNAKSKGRGTYLEFDGEHDFLQSADLNSLYDGDLSVVVVARYADAGFNHSAIISAHPDNPAYAWQIAHKGGKVQLYNGFGSGGTNASFLYQADSDWHIYYFHNDGNVSMYLDGEMVNVYSSPSIELSRMYCLKLGKNRYNNTRFYGEIAEVIIFGKALSEIERIRLFNSLSAYYAIPLSYEDYFEEGTDAYYAANVIGIGAYNSVSTSTVEGSLGLTIKGSSGVEDGEMLFIGQNTLDTSPVASNFPASLSSRLLPIFSVQESGHIGEVRIELDSSVLEASLGGDIKLVVSSDTIFTDSDAIYSMGSSNGKYGVNIDFSPNSTSYMVLATDLAILPLDLLSFQCERRGRGNYLSWTVLSSYKGLVGTQIQRRFEGGDWETIEEQNKDCPDICSFSFMDKGLGKESAFYRLKLNEGNGSYSYSPIRHVRLSHSISQKMAYPNPSNGVLNFYGKESGDLKLFDSSGEAVIQKKLRGEDKFLLDDLKDGLYFLQIESKRGDVRRQRLFVLKD